MTKTFEELEAKVNALKDDVQTLQILLHGDLEKQEIFRKAKETNTWPNIDEPPAGALDMINVSLEHLSASIQSLQSQINQRTSPTAFIAKLEAFFGPMLEGKNPPLDGNQIASRAYVDDAVARVAGVIRGELANARQGLRAESAAAVDLARQIAITALGQSGWSMVASKLNWAVDREEMRARRENKPGRIAALVYAVTGLERPRNGVQS